MTNLQTKNFRKIIIPENYIKILKIKEFIHKNVRSIRNNSIQKSGKNDHVKILCVIKVVLKSERI